MMKHQGDESTDDGGSIAASVKMKLTSTEVPGFVVTCSSEECELAGAFVEDAISVSDALDAMDDVSLNGEGGGL